MLSNPLALIAEITHRCPLHCVYCSNPLDLASAKAELPTNDWLRVFSEAAKLGVLHVHLTGGEPLARTDLRNLIAGAHHAGLYTNLITSGIGLSHERLKELVDTGLDHIQLSFQDSGEAQANWIAGTKSHAHKIELAGWIKEHRIAFTANLVVHRQNLDHLEAMISFLEKPRRVVDARALPQLRSPYRRLRWLPLPGSPAYRRRERHRSCLFSCAVTSGDRAGAPGSSHRHRLCPAARRVDLPR